MRIALVEDDAQQAELMKMWLDETGHTTQIFLAGKDCIKALSHESFDLVIIDWQLPDINGDQVLLWIREHIDWLVPTMFVTGRNNPQDIVAALENGADDYMVKPVQRNEMLARVTALGRRANAGNASEQLSIGNVIIDSSKHQLMVNGVAVELTGKEYELSVFMLKHTGRILSRGHIMESVWGRSANLNTRTVDTHISRIRKKLGLTIDNGWRLTAIYQHGYRLEHIEQDEMPAQQAVG